MNIYYSELSFSIDLIRDAYKTNDVSLIKKKLKSDLGMKVSESEIKDCITHTEDYEQISNSVSMQEIFNDG